MIELGKLQKMLVTNKTLLGAHLKSMDDADPEKVLLAKTQIIGEIAAGDTVEVFVYKNDKDALIATMKQPKIILGQVAELKVLEVTKVGAFLDWGLDRDLFLPFREQKPKVYKGETVLVCLFVDKNNRLAASMDIYRHLSSSSPFQENSLVKGTIYSINRELGAFVAVEGQYQGLIPLKELYGHHQLGQQVDARVNKVRDDGKLELSLRRQGYIEMDDDAEKILIRLKTQGGKLPVNDDSDPEVIKAEFNMSKRAFKRAVGKLFREKKIVITEDGIEMVQPEGEE